MVLCQVVKEDKATKSKLKAASCPIYGAPKVHLKLTREMTDVKILHKGNIFVFSFAEPLVIPPHECRSVVHPFVVGGKCIQCMSYVVR